MRLALVAACVLLLALLGGLVVWLSSGRAAQHFPVDPAVRDTRRHPQGGVCRSPIPPPTSLNPFTTTDPVAIRYVLPYTHDALYDRDSQTGELRPAAALDHEEDGLVVRFRLRDDLRFPDGTPVSVEDLRFTLQVASHPLLRDGSDMSYVIGQLARAEALDGRTIELERRDETGPNARLLGQHVCIVRRDWFVERVSRALDGRASGEIDDAFITALAGIRDCGPGTGAYQIASASLAEAQSEGRLDLNRNERSWRRTAQPDGWNLAGLQIRFLSEEATRLAALRRGEVDWFNPSGGTSAAAILAQHPELRDGFAIHTYEPYHIHSYQVIWNHEHAPLGDRRVRRALTMLFDRESILREIFAGVGRVAHGFYKPEEPGGSVELKELPFDPVAARALLEEAGVPAGTRIEILFPPVTTMRRILEFAKPAFASAGLELIPLPLDPQSIAARRDQGAFDAYLHVENNSYRRNPAHILGSGSNDFGYRNEELDEIGRQLSETMDNEFGIQLEQRAQALIHRDQPTTLLLYPRIELLIHRRFRDATPGPLGLHFERFWVPPEEQLFRDD